MTQGKSKVTYEKEMIFYIKLLDQEKKSFLM